MEKIGCNRPSGGIVSRSSGRSSGTSTPLFLTNAGNVMQTVLNGVTLALRRKAQLLGK